MSKAPQTNQSELISGKSSGIDHDVEASEMFDKLELHCQTISANPHSIPEQFSSPTLGPESSSNLDSDQSLSTPSLYIPTPADESSLTLNNENPNTKENVFSNILHSIADDRVVIAYKVCYLVPS